MPKHTLVSTAPHKKEPYPEFQPRSPVWPHGELVLEIMHEKGLKLSEVARRMGYKKIPRGVGKVSGFLYAEGCSADFLVNIANALEIDPAVIKEALRRTQEDIKAEEARYRQWFEDRERALFIPHLRVKFERQRPSVFLGGGPAHTILLPESIDQRSWEEQLEIIKQMIQKKYTPSTAIMGPILHYLYRQSFDVSFVFDIKGNLNTTV